MRKIFFLVVVIVGVYLFFLIRGSNDKWVCVDGQWVAYGSPSGTAPIAPCSVKDVLEGDIISYADKVQKDSRFLNTQDFTNKNLNTFPMEVLGMPDLKILNLSHNNLRSLPSQIGELVKLEELYVNYNSLTGALPGEIRKLEVLRKLDASHNNLTAIPAEIGQMKKLEKLDLGNNNINTYPNELFNIKDNLKYLNVKGNRFSVDQIVEIQDGLPSTNVSF